MKKILLLLLIFSAFTIFAQTPQNNYKLSSSEVIVGNIMLDTLLLEWKGDVCKCSDNIQFQLYKGKVQSIEFLKDTSIFFKKEVVNTTFFLVPKQSLPVLKPKTSYRFGMCYSTNKEALLVQSLIQDQVIFDFSENVYVSGFLSCYDLSFWEKCLLFFKIKLHLSEKHKLLPPEKTILYKILKKHHFI